MRIIVVNDHGSVTGGAAQVAIASLNALAEKGYEVTFVSGVSPIDPTIDTNLVKIISFGYHELVKNPSKISAMWRGLWDTRCAERFGQILNSYDPNETIIHLHTWTKSLSSSVIREACKRRFKIVCTLHDYFTICPNGGLYNYQNIEQCNLAPMSLSCVTTNCDSRYYTQKLWRVARQRVQSHFGCMPFGISAFITISDYSESILKKYLPLSTKFYRVYNPIGIAHTKKTDLDANTAFTFIGRLSPEKGAGLLAKAALKVNANTVFVGSGPEDKVVIEDNPKAKLIGWQDRIGVIKAICSSRAIVFPSLWHETQGLVVSEAAALGVPSIVSDACAARDNIINGTTGLLFRSGDVDDLAQKILLLNTNSKLLKSLGMAAYDRYWEEPHTLQNHVNELIQCYKKVLREAI